jgi:hypothetical protein
VLRHWIPLRRRRIKAGELEGFHTSTFLWNGKQNKPYISHLQLDSLHCYSLTSFMLVLHKCLTFGLLPITFRKQ